MASAWLTRHAGVAERWGYAADYRSPLLTPASPLEPMLTAATVDVAAARVLLSERGWDGVRPLVGLAPGAAYGHAKRWPPERYAALVSTLVSSHGATCVLAGAGVDAEATRQVRELASAEARPFVLDLANQTTLRTLAGLFALAQACVSNDSGAMHLAAAIGVRVVAVFGPTREKETAP